MAPESGTPASALIGPSGSLADRLFSDPQHFDFFQAVRLLIHLQPGRMPVGGDARPSDEAVRFAVSPSLAFPASEIASLEPPTKDRGPVLTAAFMGLLGVTGTLPYQYSADVAQRSSREGDDAFAAFLDIFQHRFLSLFYRSWEKYRVGAAFERGGDDALSENLYCLIGMGTGGLRGRLHAGDHILLYYAGLLAQHPRSAAALEGMLSDYFGVTVTVSQFAGNWYDADEETLTTIGVHGHNNCLGVDALLWDRVWDPQSRCRLRVGPLARAEFTDFLPTGRAFASLVELARFCAGPSIEFDVQLVLRRTSVPPCQLGMEGARLGWSAWLGGGTFDKDPDDPIFSTTAGVVAARRTA